VHQVGNKYIVTCTVQRVTEELSFLFT